MCDVMGSESRSSVDQNANQKIGKKKKLETATRMRSSGM
jgi:hypothetical protein